MWLWWWVGCYGSLWETGWKLLAQNPKCLILSSNHETTQDRYQIHTFAKTHLHKGPIVYFDLYADLHENRTMLGAVLLRQELAKRLTHAKSHLRHSTLSSCPGRLYSLFLTHYHPDPTLTKSSLRVRCQLTPTNWPIQVSKNGGPDVEGSPPGKLGPVLHVFSILMFLIPRTPLYLD